MSDSIYFAASSFVFYSAWYGGLGWFVPDRTQRQFSLFYWTRETALHDMPREELNQTYIPVRRISFPRLCLALMICAGAFHLLRLVPKSVEAQLIGLAIVAVLTPPIAVAATYGDFRPQFRLIPLVWGELLGITAVAGFMSKAKPWSLSPSEVLTQLMKDHSPRTVVMSSLVAVIGFVAATMAASGYCKPANWFAWCLVTMCIGSACVAFGLLLFHVV